MLWNPTTVGTPGLRHASRVTIGFHAGSQGFRNHGLCVGIDPGIDPGIMDGIMAVVVVTLSLVVAFLKLLGFIVAIVISVSGRIGR